MIKRSDVRHVLTQVKRHADLVHFFETITSPDWLQPLWLEGLFKDPPGPIIRGNFVSYPSWPQAVYLLRVARTYKEPEVQSLILQILKSIPDSDNEQVESTLIRVSVALRADLAKDWATIQRDRIATEDYIPPMKARALCDLGLHIAHGGFTRICLDLLRTLLDLVPDPGSEEPSLPNLEHARTKVPSWQYGLLLEKELARIVDATCVIDVLEMLLFPILDNILARDAADSDEAIDYSYVWRPNLAEAPPWDTSPRQVLVTALVSTTIAAAYHNPKQILELIELLESHQPHAPIYRRIVFHLLALFPSESRQVIASCLTTTDNLNDTHTWNDYAILLRQEFASLDSARRNVIVDHILNGPDGKAFPTADSDTRVWDEWQLRRLELIKEHLPPPAANRRDELVEQYGEIIKPELLIEYGETWVGPTSPLNLAEFSERTPTDVILFLSGWQPTDQWDGPTPEGLSRVLSQDVARKANAYSECAVAFRQFEPTYVKALVYGLTETDQTFLWGPVLDLCNWVVHQPRECQMNSTDTAFQLDRDPDWGWTRKSIAHLLKKYLRPGHNQIPYAYSNEVWNICATLMDDPEPTPEYERTYGGTNMDPMNMAINTVRGTTLQAVMAYLLWLAKHLEGSDQTTRRELEVITNAPQVQRILEAHLIIERDPSLAVRSVYGEWFTRLYSLDRNWTTENISNIFPLGPEHETYFHAAWHSYILVSPPTTLMTRLLEAQYAHAIGLLPRSPTNRMNPEYKLAEHVAEHLFLRKMPFSELELVNKFFFVANDHVRSYTVQQIAVRFSRYVRADDSERIAELLKEFWDARIVVVERAELARDYERELATFGYWFVSGIFDDQWAIDQLLRTLALSKSIKPWIESMATLHNLGSAFPSKVALCIKHLATSKNAWYFGRSDTCHNVLRQALKTSDSEERAQIVEVINYLVASGFVDFKALLD